MSIAAAWVLIPMAAFAGLLAWRWSDDLGGNRAWADLARKAHAPAASFEPSMVAGLPEPARRFFLFTIKPGARLFSAAEIRMGGEISLGTRERPNYMPMRGHQLLASPHGIVWKLRAGRGPMRILGSDGLHGDRSWVRFWLLGVIPVVRAGGNPDHARSAFGRVVAESVFFAPAALLPQNGVAWETVSADTARATVTRNHMAQSVEVTVGGVGRPVMVVIPRWSNANPAKTYRAQPFGGYLSEFRTFDGYTLPTRIEGGNFIGTQNYFPFYRAVVEDIRFITSV